MCFKNKKKKKSLPDYHRRKSNFEYLDFMETQTVIAVQARKEGNIGVPFPGGYNMLGKLESPFMDRAYTVLEEDYYLSEPRQFGVWKPYDASAFQTIKINISKSNTSKIHLMLHRKSGYLGIMKIVPYNRGANARAEMNILSMCRYNPFIIHMLDGYVSSAVTETYTQETTANYYLFLEYAPFRTLDHLAKSVNGIGSNNARLYGLEIACALDFLHERNIIHRHLAPDNVLVLLSGHVALGDLSSAIQIEQDMKMSRTCGNYVTRPPEVWAGSNYTSSVDIWQFGVTLFYIICNEWPFVHPNTEKHINSINTSRVMYNSSFTETACSLISQMLKVQPTERLTIRQVLQHKFFDELTHPYNPPFTPHELTEMYNFGNEEVLIRELVSQLR